MNLEIQKITSLGQSIWLDSISREMLVSKKLKSLVDQGVTGVTSNPAIFQKALSSENIYDSAINDLANKFGSDPKVIFQKISIEDISSACDVLMDVFDRTEGKDGFVSIEIDPKFANNTDESIKEGLMLNSSINKPNVMIKVPGTEAGMPVITKLISLGINVNVTLLFGRDMYIKSVKSYISGLKLLKDSSPEKISKVNSVASFFISRIDTAIDNSIENGDEGLKGEVAIANAVLAYNDYLELFASNDFKELEKFGAKKQRLLWASTSVKNPEFDSLMYVKNLVAKETINTLPELTLDLIKNGNNSYEDKIKDKFIKSQNIIKSIEQKYSLNLITGKLLENGVNLFINAFDELLDELSIKINK